MNNIKAYEKTMTTKEVAEALKCEIKTVLNNAVKCLPSKLIEHGKVTLWTETELTILLEFMKLPSVSGKKSNSVIQLQSTETSQSRALRIEMLHKQIEAELKAEIAELETKNAIMQPKADYFDALVDRNLLTSFRDTAKELNVRQTDFINFLVAKKYLYRDQKDKLMPYAEKNGGLFELKETKNDGNGWAGIQTLITPKGREVFRLMMQAKG